MVILTREQLEDRLAVLHRASLELVGDLTSKTVLERIVKIARQQVGARYAALGVFDRHGNLDQFIPIGMTQEEIERMPNQPLGLGLLGMIHEEPRTIRIPEVSDDPRSVGFPKNHPEMHAFLGVPIMLGDKPLGQLYLADKIDYHEFTDQDERVIETLAAYAAVAINNARMYGKIVRRDRQLTQRNEDLNLLNEAATILASSFYVDDILEKTLRLVMSYLGLEAAEIFLHEDGDKDIQLTLHRGEFSETFFYRDHFPIGQDFVGRVAETNEPILCTNLEDEIESLRPAVLEAGFKCLAFIPLCASREVVGVLVGAARDVKQIDERRLHLLTSIGKWTGITLENARLNRQSRRLAVLEERERIGMDLHDGIIQSIYGVGLTLDYVRMLLSENPEQAQSKIDESIEDLNKTIRDIRAYILDLRPRQFHGDDLKQGLQQLIDEFRANSGTTAVLVGPEDGLVDFPAANATALFHICQESLANIAKHANAQYAEVHLWSAKDRVLLEVSDNGKGFDLQKMSVTLGHGLSNMHVRTRKVGGDVEITSQPGKGTTILAWVPRW